ncbi:hypothetical protein L873DRAFT_741576 [Choiromyces venosus 120613-1]|uniref:Tc1-like transposase DDE domain-containing protein n=1 Tax=Choiromyces venosus 120613-1 TaxID=1336337 RepID=A0A3N4JR16_9PEZI|nr:hypothetical protein L873DRAFT_741576 [Choiromyces venosus 120613-1]
MVEDGVSYHTSEYTTKHQIQLSIKCMDWPLHSPDLNPIENVWGIFKKRYQKAVWKRKRIPRNMEELIGLAQEVWSALPWGRIYGWIDRIPERVNFCLRRNGGPTQW